MEQKFRQMDLNFMLARAGRRAPMILPTIELMTHKTDYMKAVLNTVSRNEYTHYFTIKDDFPNFYDELWKLNTAIPLYLTTKEKFNRNKKGLPVVTIMGWFDRSEPRNDGLHDLKGEECRRSIGSAPLTVPAPTKKPQNEIYDHRLRTDYAPTERTTAVLDVPYDRQNQRKMA